MERETADWQEEGSGRVAFLGLGIMGEPMAANLARAGFDLSVWTRTGEKAERFAAEHGVRAAATPAEAAEGATAAVIDGGGRARRSSRCSWATTGPPGALAGGGLCVDMSTIAPTAALGSAARLAEARPGLRGRAGHRLAAAGRGRQRSRSWWGPRTRPSPGRDRCSRPWAGWWCTSGPPVTGR